MDDLNKNLALVAASLEALSANTKANADDLEEMEKRLSADLRRMAIRTRQNDEEIQKLNGTFASLERHLVKLFEDNAQIQAWKEAIEARVAALEKRVPPAA